jgi:hypothetical protein
MEGTAVDICGYFRSATPSGPSEHETEQQWRVITSPIEPWAHHDTTVPAPKTRATQENKETVQVYNDLPDGLNTKRLSTDSIHSWD